MSSPFADRMALRRALIVAAACVIAVWAGVALTQSPYLFLAGSAAAVYLSTLAVNAKWLTWLIIAVQPAALIVPFFPGRPFVWELCTLLAWPSLVAYLLLNINRHDEVRFDRTERNALLALAGYVLVLGGIMIFRGVGLRVLGGQQMGGRIYVQQVVLAVLPLLLLSVRLRRGALWSAVVTGWVLSLTYLLAEVAYSSRASVLEPLLYFLELPTDGLNFSAGYEMTGVRRYGALAAVATSGFACLWTLAPMREILGRWIWLGAPFAVFLYLAGMGSGYRNMVLMPALTFVFLGLFQRFWTPRTITAVVFSAGAALFCVYMVADRLPLPVQRSISFLPGLDISPVAKADAATTNMDRWEVMKLAIRDVPKYLVAGRGFGMERFDKVSFDPSMDGVRLLYAQGMFYNGVIGTLLKTGLPGLICTVLFALFVSKLALELIRLVVADPAINESAFGRLCLFLCAHWFAMVAAFYLTNGDINFWMQTFGFSGSIIMACRHILLSGKTAELVVAMSPQAVSR